MNFKTHYCDATRRQSAGIVQNAVAGQFKQLQVSRLYAKYRDKQLQNVKENGKSQ